MFETYIDRKACLATSGTMRFTVPSFTTGFYTIIEHLDLPEDDLRKYQPVCSDHREISVYAIPPDVDILRTPGPDTVALLVQAEPSI